MPLSPNWWVDRSPGAAKKDKWCAVKPIPNLENKRVDFELVRGRKGGTKKNPTIITDDYEYDPNTTTTISRGVGKCPNCGTVIEDEQIKAYSSTNNFGHQLYVVAYKSGKSSIEFRSPQQIDFDGIEKSKIYLEQKYPDLAANNTIPIEPTSVGLYDSPRNYEYGLQKYEDCFNPRQLLTLVTYVEIINEVKSKLQIEYEPEKVKAIAIYSTPNLPTKTEKPLLILLVSVIWVHPQKNWQNKTTKPKCNWHLANTIASYEMTA